LKKKQTLNDQAQTVTRNGGGIIIEKKKNGLDKRDTDKGYRKVDSGDARSPSIREISEKKSQGRMERKKLKTTVRLAPQAIPMVKMTKEKSGEEFKNKVT